MGNNPIGIFDSGVGGLSIFKEIRQQLPFENLIYFADTRYAPYGDKPQVKVEERVAKVGEFFKQQSVKAVVVACNTATAIAVNQLRSTYTFPIIGLEPAVKPAVQVPGKTVGVLATANTLASEKYQALKARYQKQATIIDCACHGLVDYIEAGKEDSAECYQLLTRYLQPLQNQHVDTLVLGCTHYPFIKKQIQKIVGYDVELLDSADAVAKHLATQLREGNLNTPSTEGSEHFFSTASTADVMKRLLQRDVRVERVEI